MQFPHHRNLGDGAPQQGAAQDGQNRMIEQHAMNPAHQAYYQYALQASQQSNPEILATHGSSKETEVWSGNLKMQDFMAAQASSSKSSFPGEKQPGQVSQSGSDQRHEARSTAQPVVRPLVHEVHGHQSMPNNQLAVAQMQIVQSWAAENNVDLSLPANANMMAQLFPLMQARMLAQHKANESNSGLQSSLNLSSKPQAVSPSITSESSSHANSHHEASGQTASGKTRQAVSVGPSAQISAAVGPPAVSNSGNMVQQFSSHGREVQVPHGKAHVPGSGMLPMRPPQTSSASLGLDMQPKKPTTIPKTVQMQNFRQLNQSSPQPPASSAGGSSNNITQVGAAVLTPSQHYGFTKQQLHVLKAQILAFRRLKKKETLPQELLRSIVPPPLDAQSSQQQPLPAGGSSQDKSVKLVVDARPAQANEEVHPQHLINMQNNSRDPSFVVEGKASASDVQIRGAPPTLKGTSSVQPAIKEDHQRDAYPVKVEQESEHSSQKTPAPADFAADKGKDTASQGVISDVMQGKKPAQSSAGGLQKDAISARKYHGPLFDFPYFTRKYDSIGSTPPLNTNDNLTLAYNLKDLLIEEGLEVLNERRAENLKKIGGLLAINLERKRIRPDLVLRLQIEEKKLRLVDLQARLREEVDKQQQEIMAMPDRPYRKFVRLCERQRIELNRQVQASQRALREKQLKSVFHWRKKLLEAHWAIRDARTARNRGVAKYHERMLREFSKRKDDDHDRRMEALKNNDVERYREMLLEQQTAVPGDAAERYAVLSSFLTQTEEYLQKLGGKITAAKNQQEVEEAANAATAAARLQGLSEEEVRAAAACAGEEVMIRNRFMEMNAPKDSSSVSKYYSLAHAVNERVLRQPSMLKAGTLRDYQLVGLQWMLSLYNNKLNGILADEMGLGKTVQVMALIAYLMEFKGNYGPHLIIVPNAVLVNWKSEFYNWLPSVSCIFYVGSKDQRSRLFSQEVSAMKFNVLVTTYEFIMYDRSKLSKVDWKYIIIDEAQRMKDRESVLARDLDRYRCQRRLLLTGTPLQNELKELWSLLNLLLPEVFDNKKVFHDWFSKPFQKEGPCIDAEDDWLETEKKVIIIHRLHQILEPFMLRRRVEDVEGSLPPKVSVVLRCKMSAIQSAIYDWIKSTGTLRVDPEDEQRKVQRNPIYQARMCKTLNNRCMELRKACNHPLLNYPYFSDLSKDFLVKSCGKLWILDRILIKLQRTGHRVLLFSTMTKLLDILEEYLQWKRLVYRRIDGTTSLEDRESAIVDFNLPDSDCFIFLLSIRAAGRGLNLQSADTVIIYDPDPNPKNEEQAVARAHRIGQTREVKVIYMEAVVDKIPSHQKEDELRSGGIIDMEDDLAGKDRYMGSIESLIRNNIQQYKIDMADEVINAGRFDQRTTHEERRLTLETLLHDEERYQETVHDVPSLEQVNRMIARSEREVELFDQMDEELDWIEEMTSYEQVPKWLRASTKEVNDVVSTLSKKPSKRALFGGSIGSESPKSERKRGRPKAKKHINYKEVDDEIGEYSEASSDEANEEYAHEEEGEIEEFDNDPYPGATGALPVDKDELEEDAPPCEEGEEYTCSSERDGNDCVPEHPGSSGSSAGSQRPHRTASPSVSSQKFCSLSALDGRPSSMSKRLSVDICQPEELEEGEIAISGDFHADHQQSESWIHEREEGEDEQVVQPKIKRKRSIRMRPRHALDKGEGKSSMGTPPLQSRDPTLLLRQMDNKHQMCVRSGAESSGLVEYGASKQEGGGPSMKNKRQTSLRRMSETKVHTLPKSVRSNSMASSDVAGHIKESWDAKTLNPTGTSVANCVPDFIQRKCKNVVNKLQRRIDKEGQHIVPRLTDLWKRAGSNLLDLRKIDKRVERLEYTGVMDLVFDVQLMLKGAMQFYGFSHEVRSEARKVHNLFFDILRIAFPDTDFEESRSALSFSGPLSTSASSQSAKPLTAGQGNRGKPMKAVDIDTQPKKMMRQAPSINQETTRIRVSLNQKDSGSASGSRNSREASQRDESPLLAHPGELVICKKKRKDREKVPTKPRSGLLPISPAGTSQGIASPGMASMSKDLRSATPSIHHQGWMSQSGQAGNSVGGDASWANPVKRLRTDSARRRASHM
ncbi:hypothetical protein MLD38_019777 [Melastoma candidum]|uniref:Uncharacterized protein n=1 Tax=Melastoma candidum TaxID=119954 RepID=A0ACB9R6D6_9MYRT|nr:hypothetical protein MLD38_019777 [Melastoma candidum]